jgi:hypothetical protein
MRWTRLARNMFLGVSLLCLGLPEAEALEIFAPPGVATHMDDGLITQVRGGRGGGGGMRHGGGHRGGGGMPAAEECTAAEECMAAACIAAALTVEGTEAALMAVRTEAALTALTAMSIETLIATSTAM